MNDNCLVVRRFDEIINQIIDLIRTKYAFESIELVVKFARRYFATISYEDLIDKRIEDLYGACISHWQLLYQRQKNRCKVNIFNPNRNHHGWYSSHTIIQIIHDDMPFLVDSIRMRINRSGFLIHLIINLGNMAFVRDDRGHVIDLVTDDSLDESNREAVIHIEIDRQIDEAKLLELQHHLINVLADVTVTVEDWSKMRDFLNQSLLELEKMSSFLNRCEIIEASDFLKWLDNNNFTFLGCREYQLVSYEGEKILQVIPDSGLGVLRESKKMYSRYLSELPHSSSDSILFSQILVFSKTKTRSTIHRPAYTDYIAVKRFNHEGEFIGERRFIGLYGSSAYHSRPADIPFLRHKVAKVIEESNLNGKTHTGKKFINILESLPRDDLFQASADELLQLATKILHLQDRQRIRLFIRRDGYGRFYSCLVFLPQDTFHSALCDKMKIILAKEFDAEEVSFQLFFSQSMLVCLHFVVHVNPKNKQDYDVKDIEKKLVNVGLSWVDKLKLAFVGYYGEAHGLIYYQRYRDAFPAGYRENFSPKVAIDDIQYIESLNSDHLLAMNFSYFNTNDGDLQFKVFQLNNVMAISDALPILENMGLRVIAERPCKISLASGHIVWVNDFDISYPSTLKINIDEIKSHLHDAFLAIWFKMSQDDSFNNLILTAQLTWHEVNILRAYAKYFHQIGIPYSARYIASTLNNYPMIARDLIDLFLAKFNPINKTSSIFLDNVRTKIIDSLDQVVNLDQDKIIRYYLEVIQATLRTNYFKHFKTPLSDSDQENKARDNYLSFKLNSENIKELPLPKPRYEIYVYSPRFEGVHLRAAKVARGGIRWSSRFEDFRTEILGLMKAQCVKNSVIIPDGAKGGFITKYVTKEMSHKEVLTEGRLCYQLFITALLELTDNICSGKVIHPLDIAIHDDEDLYLVVAADKGTATFSDIANEVAISRDFWLGDAFASGGMTGYDHKKIAITARGAWESVKRHFRELDFDIQKNNFTVIGIGDMAGDVFGNGMLLSPCIQLIAAFNHLHIFIDPNPDADSSFNERQRLFNLSQSSWKDYNMDLISKGGGVFKRSAKSIALSEEIKKILMTNKNYLTPNELIHALLCIKVDLLWNGGIGTFVKSSSESNRNIGDRVNDPIRVNGCDLRCRVVGEGGNLGFTQLARIEYELQGGRIYTDFIDNAAGVNCSDHEVNIKILLNDAVANGKLDQTSRNELLVNMTDEIANLVLYDNYCQTQAISFASFKAKDTLNLDVQYMTDLVNQGKLDIDLEFLPNEEVIIERKANNYGLTRPDLAVLFAYSKNILKQQLLSSNVPEDPYLSKMIASGFPKQLYNNYSEEMKNHSLYREIIATQVSSNLINQLGFTFIPRLQEETGASVANIVRAFTISHKIFGKTSLWQAIEGLDLQIKSREQFAMMQTVNRLIRRSTRWFLIHYSESLVINDLVAHFARPIALLANHFHDWLCGEMKESYLATKADFIDLKVPEKIAKRIAACLPLFSALDIVSASIANGWQLKSVAKTYYFLDVSLELSWLRQEIHALPSDNRWHALHRTSLHDELDWQQRLLTVKILQQLGSHNNSDDIQSKIKRWLVKNDKLIMRWQSSIASLKATKTVNIVMLSVVMRQFSSLVQIS